MPADLFQINEDDREFEEYKDARQGDHESQISFKYYSKLAEPLLQEEKPEAWENSNNPFDCNDPSDAGFSDLRGSEVTPDHESEQTLSFSITQSE